ncbi:hypothetical protein [Fictibacillus sp. 18YEL24]|uniref:hypothetical protein n=1 Tax=Fictibacillus sp. 18YEL24 TaxID=2745875 RepID=UPI0018CF5B2A|nr:hypothetical protein [Fictibacillus sp. 18YEL24]MBH0169177.1 hypothetical protein [Fictibacillus sp. 18YEL24]
MGNVATSSKVNKNVLTVDLKLRQYSNTTIYTKRNLFVLSPSVQNAYSWFDVRKVNLDRFQQKDYKGYLLIRYFDKFLLTDLESFTKQMTPSDKYVNSPKTGAHWKFLIKPSLHTYQIMNQQTKNTYFINEVTHPELLKILSSY